MYDHINTTYLSPDHTNRKTSVVTMSATRILYKYHMKDMFVKGHGSIK